MHRTASQRKWRIVCPTKLKRLLKLRDSTRGVLRLGGWVIQGRATLVIRDFRIDCHRVKNLRMQSISLSVVVPVYNEAENVRPLLDQLRVALEGWPARVEFLFVDDGSTDQTLELLKEAQEKESRIRIAHFRTNLGQTAAMAAGFHLAQGSSIVTLDGDLQNDPAEIPRLAEMLKDWDAVCGVRTRRQDGGWKRLSSRIANGFRNWATGDDIIDTGCTLKAYRSACLERLELYRGMHRFLPTLLKMRGYRVTQVPVSHHPRLHGKTKYGTWGRMVKGLADVWAVRWMQKNKIDYQAELEVLEKLDNETSAEVDSYPAASQSAVK
jgi:dolichol-phosphate mannosyltransferase